MRLQEPFRSRWPTILTGWDVLIAPALVQAPEKAIVEAARNGELTPDTLADLIAEAARQQSVATYCADMKRNCERPLVAAFHKALQSGAADLVLDSLRPAFDKAVAAIETARDLIPTDQPAEQFMHSAKPAALSAWQKLDGHLAVITAIGAIAARFGCRTARFRLIEEYTLADNFRLDDRPLFCCDGELEADSRPFGRPDSGHRTSPWFRTALKLHSVKGARDRYRGWAAVEWERINAGPTTSWLGDDGQMHEQPRPENPFKAKESVT